MAAGAAALAGGRQSHWAGWLEQNLDVLAVSDAFGRFRAILIFGAFLTVLECFWTFLHGFGAFRTLVLALDTTRGDRYIAITVDALAQAILPQIRVVRINFIQKPSKAHSSEAKDACDALKR